MKFRGCVGKNHLILSSGKLFIYLLIQDPFDCIYKKLVKGLYDVLSWTWTETNEMLFWCYMYLLKMFQLIVNANLNKLIMKGKREEAIVSKMKGSCLLVKKARIRTVMSLCIGLERALSNSWSVTVALLGRGSGLLFTKTLHWPRALGTLNCTILPKPYSCRDSVAL